MKKLLLFSVLSLFIFANANSQAINTYTFQNAVGNYTPLAGDSSITLSQYDDAISASIYIGFGFQLGPTTYTTFKLNSNGWISLDPAAVSTTNYSPLSGTVNQIISGFSRDLNGTAANSTRYSILRTGSSPNGILKIQYNNIYSYNGGSQYVPENGSFQIWLFEGTNKIEIHYGSFIVGARTVATTVQVGIRGATTGATDVLAANGTTWTGAASSNLNTATVTINTTTLPDSNRVFTFSPPVSAPIDAQAVSISPSGAQFYPAGTTNVLLTGTFKNNGTSSGSIYSAIKVNGAVVNSSTVILAAGASTSLTYSLPFTSGTTYDIRDSSYIAGDGNPLNNVVSTTFTPSVAKTFAIYYRNFTVGLASRDSLVNAITANGTFVGAYDLVNADSYTGSLTPWKTIFACFDGFSNGTRWTTLQRDSMKSFLDQSTAGNIKTLLYFDFDAGYYSIAANGGTAADLTFYNQYLKSSYIVDSWYTAFTASNQNFKGVPGDPTFGSYGTDSITGLYPDLIQPVNGGLPAFIPATESGNGDSCLAVYYHGAGQVAGSFYNSFLMSNAYSYFRTRANGTLDNPNTLFNQLVTWIQSNGGVLPVELASFNSNVSNRNVTLNWATTSENNNAGFDIERKLTATSNWSKVGNVAGAGNSNQGRAYTFADNNLNSGKYNYRLKQMDFNGNFKYYDLSNEVIIGVPSKFELSQNYPNPFNPSTKINYDLPFDSKVAITLFDMTGREVANIVNTVQTAGSYTVSFNASTLSSGVYFYQISAVGGTQNFVKTMKMMLVK